jgi:integral membrane protein (TIGR01906 family)
MQRWLRWLIVVAVPVVLTMTMVRVLTAGWYPALQYGRSGFPGDPYGLAAEERLRLAQASIRFINTPGRTSILADLRLPDGSAAYNARELAHMDDVKAVFNGLTLLAVAWGAGALVAALVLIRRGARCTPLAAAAQGGALTLALLVSLALWMLVAFDAFFTFFHGLFFQPGTWTFDYSDTLIRLFPLPFWQDAGMIIAVAVSLISAVLVAGGTYGYRRCQMRLEGESQ